MAVAWLDRLWKQEAPSFTELYAGKGTVPAVDFSLVRRFVRDELPEAEAQPVRNLVISSAAWRSATAAAHAEVHDPPPEGIDFEVARRFVRDALPDGRALAVRFLSHIEPSWRLALKAARNELLEVSDVLGPGSSGGGA